VNIQVCVKEYLPIEQSQSQLTENSGDNRSGGAERASDLFDKANSAYDSGDYELAVDLFDKVIGLGMTSETVYNNKGAALDALNRREDAVRNYALAVKTRPDYELAWHNLGNSRFSEEMWLEAAAAYRKAARLNPKRWENLSGLAAAYIRSGQVRKAKAVIGNMSGFARADPSFSLAQAELYLDAGYHDLAVRCCEEYISRNPGSSDGYSMLGNAHHEAGEFAKAVSAFEEALKREPDNSEIWNNLGFSSFSMGDLEKATKSFDKALSIDPQYKHAWYNKGYALHGADRLEEAVECYARALAIDKNDKVLWNNLGNALYNLGKYAESIPKFVSAISVDQDYEIAWNNIGNALEKMGMHIEAIPFHDRSLDIRPDFDYALYAKGVCRAAIGDVEGGYDLILESLDLNPTYDEAWKARARVAMVLGRWDEALMSIEESLSVNPSFDEGWAERGELMLMMGELEAAEKSFQTALACLENIPHGTVAEITSTIRRAEMLLRLGRFEEALATLESLGSIHKLGPHALTLILDIRRMLGMWHLPSGVTEALESSGDDGLRIRYSDFLTDTGEPAKTVQVIEASIGGTLGRHARLVKAKALVALGRIPEAAHVLKSLEGTVAPSDDTLLTAQLEEVAGEIDKALADYERSLQAMPSRFSAAIAIARIRATKSQPTDALRAADLAIGIDSREWEPFELKSRCLLAKGDHKRSDRMKHEAKARIDNMGLATAQHKEGERA
jgi:tetratricopeptide (TPR) repeat protein